MTELFSRDLHLSQLEQSSHTTDNEKVRYAYVRFLEWRFCHNVVMLSFVMVQKTHNYPLRIVVILFNFLLIGYYAYSKNGLFCLNVSREELF